MRSFLPMVDEHYIPQPLPSGEWLPVARGFICVTMVGRLPVWLVGFDLLSVEAMRRNVPPRLYPRGSWDMGREPVRTSTRRAFKDDPELEDLKSLILDE